MQRAVASIPAHDTPLAALAFNSSGSKLATASTTVGQETPLIPLFSWLKVSYVGDNNDDATLLFLGNSDQSLFSSSGGEVDGVSKGNEKVYSCKYICVLL